MYVPINTTVTLDITASDVVHSWWIPTLGGKADAVPGYTNHTWFRISEPGVYQGQCAELCGEGHADMIARVHALTPDAVQGLAPEAGRRHQGSAGAARARAKDPRAGRTVERISRNVTTAETAAPVAAPREVARPEIVAHKVEEPPKGWLSWLTTTDHKRIGIMYIATTLRVLRAGRRRGAADAPPARRARQHDPRAARSTTSS